MVCELADAAYLTKATSGNGAVIGWYRYQVSGGTLGETWRAKIGLQTVTNNLTNDEVIEVCVHLWSKSRSPKDHRVLAHS